MILGVGIDIVEVERIRRVVERYGDRFLRRVYTPDELEQCGFVENDALGRIAAVKQAVEKLAGRFAAKEAFLKALGTGLAQGLTWQHIAIARGNSGAPELMLRGRAAEIARSRSVESQHVSISHSGGSAVAIVILEGSEEMAL